MDFMILNISLYNSIDIETDQADNLGLYTLQIVS